MPAPQRILALAGGVGGAKLAHGLAMTLAPENLMVVVNTADDFIHLGLHVSPDLDTVMYTLAGINNPETGWGIAGESWAFMDALGRLGGETWFRLGDRDLATHVERSRRLAAGETLSRITRDFYRRLGIGCTVAPMSDAAVRTVVTTADGRRLAFQDYFVRERCAPAVTGFSFDGAAAARPAPALTALIDRGGIEAAVICPSNPYVSIDPTLAVPDIGNFLRSRTVPVVAVSPIVGGAALKGPAAKMMRELGNEPSALGIARHFAGIVDGLIIDEADAAIAGAIEAVGLRVLVAPTVMSSAERKAELARRTVAYARALEDSG